MIWLLNGEKSLRICSLSSTEYRSVTDGRTDVRTDRQTDRQTSHDGIARCIASRGKNHKMKKTAEVVLLLS